MTTIFETALQGKHVVIVGGSSGMGKATAKLAVALGATVTIASRSADKLASAAAEIGDVKTVPLDMTDEAGVKAWAAQLGAVDHLVISASSVAHGAYVDLSTNDLRGMIEAKFIGPYVAARESSALHGQRRLRHLLLRCAQSPSFGRRHRVGGRERGGRDPQQRACAGIGWAGSGKLHQPRHG